MANKAAVVNYIGSLVLVHQQLDTTGTVTLLTARRDLRLALAWGVMNGAGASGDKIKLTDGTNDITDDVDVSAKSDTDLFLFGKIDDAYRDLGPGATLQAVNTSAALVDVFVLLIVTTPPV